MASSTEARSPPLFPSGIASASASVGSSSRAGFLTESLRPVFFWAFARTASSYNFRRIGVCVTHVLPDNRVPPLRLDQDRTSTLACYGLCCAIEAKHKGLQRTAPSVRLDTNLRVELSKRPLELRIRSLLLADAGCTRGYLLLLRYQCESSGRIRTFRLCRRVNSNAH